MAHRRLQVFIATSNIGKLRELLMLFEPLSHIVEPITPNELNIMLDFEEREHTFSETAKAKALHAAKCTGLLSLAEDSGLEIDALDGFPGRYSARFMGRMTAYEDKNRAILDMLRHVPDRQRTARYRCAMALAHPDEVIAVVEDIVEGRIAHEPRGSGGFGYDPIFYLPGLGCTMAQLPLNVKNRISHRGRAFERLRPFLEQLAQVSDGT
ncbi:MAG TPA: RdgB/HAM1 family non-canonical purine NTP pyrophosphatase [Armatimonadetes bacterium]|nr:RdgB/HAM1 family non-canonical purine NTP pyrophosphatase [Armatimonadota bacterium]